jgi:hypothetical protein
VGIWSEGGGDNVMVVRGRSRLGVPSPTSMSVTARLGSVYSVPSAAPIRAPACGTISIGADVRFTYPDFTRLFDTDSL